MAGLILLALVHALVNRFIQDDAFISFVYARNLVTGQGLTWFGICVEGYTNFLWVLLISLGMRINIEPVLFSHILGILFFVVAVYCTSRIALDVTESKPLSLLATLLLIGNYSFASYATGGLETMMQTALVSLAMLYFYQARTNPESSNMWHIFFSIFCGLAILTRPDSVVLIAIIWVFQIFGYIRRKAKVATYLSMILPCLILVTIWVSWKTSYYGRIFPNTYYAKIGWNISVNANGILFLLRFLHWYLMWPFIVLGALTLITKKIRPSFKILPLITTVFTWSLYIIAVGGDFMEFRFIVPMGPYLFVMITYLVFITGKHLFNRPIAYCSISLVILLAASWHHSSTFRGITKDHLLDSIDSLSRCYGIYPNKNWRKIGDGLKRELGDTDTIVATTTAGAIPFYSQLKTIDMWGLNDLVIPFEGDFPPKRYLRPGHRRYAKLSYLKDQRVNFIIGFPTLVRPGTIAKQRWAERLGRWLRDCVPFHPKPIDEAIIVTIPIDSQWSLLTWYLTPAEKLDQIIEDRGWEVKRLRFAQW